MREGGRREEVREGGREERGGSNWQLAKPVQMTVIESQLILLDDLLLLHYRLW